MQDTSILLINAHKEVGHPVFVSFVCLLEVQVSQFCSRTVTLLLYSSYQSSEMKL